MYRISAIYQAAAGTHFDKEYYLAQHVPLAFKQLQGKVNILRVEVEWDLKEIDWATHTGPAQGRLLSPCRFSAIVDTETDLLNFFRFMKSPDREPLHSDVKNYTNCDMMWVVSELLEPGTC